MSITADENNTPPVKLDNKSLMYKRITGVFEELKWDYFYDCAFDAFPV